MNNFADWLNARLMEWGFGPKTAGILDQAILIALLLVAAVVIDYLSRRIILGILGKIVKRTKTRFDDWLLSKKVVDKLLHIIPALLAYSFIPVFFSRHPGMRGLLQKICIVYIIALILQFISILLNIILEVYSRKEAFKNRPMKGFFQVMQVILFFVGGIIIISVLIDKSPATLFAGLGASAAVLMLVFRDSILGFVSGIQLSANDMLRPGDWITMPKYGADGTVTEVTLNTVKVKNFDNTITTIPPYALVSDAFQNWRGMEESAGRRVKRSINIDMNSVRFCTDEMLEKFRRIYLLQGYIDEKQQELTAYNRERHIDESIPVNGKRQTNLGVFRAYLLFYLRSLTTVNQQMTCMVRHLQPTTDGIPIELYFFSAIKTWETYEGVQADVFDHILAIVPEFGLSVFQNPSGADFRSFTGCLRDETTGGRDFRVADAQTDGRNDPGGAVQTSDRPDRTK